jgi:PAS domain S-box-containing protein
MGSAVIQTRPRSTGLNSQAWLRVGAGALVGVFTLTWPFEDQPLGDLQLATAAAVALVVATTGVMQIVGRPRTSRWPLAAVIVDTVAALVLIWAFDVQPTVGYMLSIPVMVEASLVVTPLSGLIVWVMVSLSFLAVPDDRSNVPLLWPLAGLLVAITTSALGLELSRQRERLRLLFDRSPDALLLIDARGTIRGASQAVSTVLGYEPEALVGCEVELLVPESLRAAHRRFRRNFMEEPRDRRMGSGLSLSAIRADGTEIPVDITLSYQRLGGHETVIAAVRDISDQARLMTAVRESEQRFRAIVESIDEVIFILEPQVDSPPTVTLVSGRSAAVTGHAPEEFEADPNLWATMIHPDDLPSVIAAQQELVPGAKPVSRFYRMRPKGAQGWRWFEDRVSLVETAVGPRVFGSARDVTESYEAAEALRRSFDDLRLADEGRRALLRRLADVTEHERSQIAMELHEGAIQQLAAAKLRLDLAVAQPPNGRRLPEEVSSWLEETMGSLRNIVQELHPPGLEKAGGVTAALQELAGEAEKRGGCPTSVRELSPVGTLDARVSVNVYRIVQEALTNVWKHADATEASVTLQQRGEELQVDVTDNGRGFDTSAQAQGHFGLMFMRERAEAIDGSLEIGADEGGTHIRLVVHSAV